MNKVFSLIVINMKVLKIAINFLLNSIFEILTSDLT